MNLISTTIADVKLIETKSFHDSRGFFVERFKKQALKDLGLPSEFIQDNFSRSNPKVLRGLHYQFSPVQSKLVTCISGRILDVAVDIRLKSPTFGQHVAFELSGDRPTWAWIPGGFAHGFVVLGDQPADVLYKVDAPYGPQGEGCIHWNDREIGIQWPFLDAVVSDKDAKGQSFQEYKKSPRF